MFFKPTSEIQEEDASTKVVNCSIEDQHAKNSYLEAELERFAAGLRQVRQSRIGRFALKIEQFLHGVKPVSGSDLLSEAERIAQLPLDEREAFARVNIEQSDALTVAYTHLVSGLGVPEEAEYVNEDLIRCVEELNGELYQELIQSQVLVGRGLGGAFGHIAILGEILWNAVCFKGRRTAYLRGLWTSFIAFRKDHAADLEGISAQDFSRLRYLLQVLRYFLAHPYASLRIFSWRRLWRLGRVLLGLEQLNGAAWIEQRFPLDSAVESKPIVFAVDEAGAQSLELSFPIADEPLVSIIIPVYNQYATTLSCLQAVLAHSTGISYEVIVADDRSSDLTETISDRIGNIRVVRNEVNLGFLKNCNNAAQFARGKYVVLLNNDTNPQPGWLHAMLRVFTEHEGVGLVGPKLLFEDGVLQEAGGIIWRDGSGWNFGRGQNPDAPEFNYLKDVDYISGACVMLEKCLWDELGGFDERFCPAYYEDTDLAFQIRERGLRTVYQPASRVVHFEGVSHGSDLNSGIKKQQRVNQLVFQKKWKKVLDEENHPVGANVFNARERADGKRTVLFIDHYVPFYDKDAGSRSTFLYVKAMVEMGYRVKFLGANFFPHEPYTETLQAMGVEVLYGERYARNWKTWLKGSAKNIDVIYLHRPHITEDFIEEIVALKDRPKMVYFGHDLHYLRTEREAAVKGDRRLIKEASSWKQRELKIFSQVDTVLYPSDVEVRAVKDLAPGVNVDQIPLYLLSPQENSEFVHESRRDLLFVGGFVHAPNVDAVIWFVSEVLPLILQNQPEIKFHVVGSNVPEVISALASDNIIVHGFVEDDALAQLYKSIRVCVVPLRYGAGVKGKVLEALQNGVPLVTTPVGAEGIPSASEVMAVAETASEFSEKVLELFTDTLACARYLQPRQSYIEKHYSINVVKDVIQRHFG